MTTTEEDKRNRAVEGNRKRRKILAILIDSASRRRLCTPVPIAALPTPLANREARQ